MKYEVSLIGREPEKIIVDVGEEGDVDLEYGGDEDELEIPAAFNFFQKDGTSVAWVPYEQVRYINQKQ